MKEDKVFIIAELSANHNNDLNLAIKTLQAMSDSGADAVKVQTYTADSLSLNVKNEYFSQRKEGLWKGRTPYELFQEASLPYNWHSILKRKAEDLGLLFFSSPFDKGGVDFLEELNVPMYKIASMEITDIPLIAYVASKGKPVIISTGVAEIVDIELALDACHRAGNDDIILLKCTSQYPATIEQANLLTISDMIERFDVKVGVSDHTFGTIVPIISVAMGASVVEKHFILDRKLGGPDSAFSMEPAEFRLMVDAVRDAEKARGQISYIVSNMDKLRRRSLFVVKDIRIGESFTQDNIRSIRPGDGLHPKNFYDIIGKKAKMNLTKGTPLTFDHIS